MSLKLKVLGLGLLATLAMSAVAVVNASAEVGGHFVGEENHLDLKVTEGGAHITHLFNHGLEGEVGCTEDLLHGTFIGGQTTAGPPHVQHAANTATQVTITGEYKGCTTTSNGTAVPVDMNGCDYLFTVKGTITTPESHPGTNTIEQTAHLVCPTGNKIQVTHPNCTVSIHPQTVSTGITYTTHFENNKHTITVDLNVEFTTTRHGLCQFVVPTDGTGTLKGSATVEGFKPGTNELRSITAT